MPKQYDSMAERLIANSVISCDRTHGGTPCWEWIGARCKNRSGMFYGKLTVRAKRGPRKGKPITHMAHRLAIVHLKGRRLTAKSKAMHLCNYSLCINPDHLVGGSQRANVRQCVRDGRHVSGFAKHHAKKRARRAVA